MALNKEDYILGIGGILATAGVSFWIYRLQRNDAAQQAQASADAAAEQQSELANQQAQVASLPQISVPAISATPSTTDTTNQATAPATDSILEQIIAGFQSQDNSSVTSTSTPLAAITQLPLPATPYVPPVVVPPVQTFSTTPASGQSYTQLLPTNPLKNNPGAA